MSGLSSETSPYLRMHIHNPVDWRPWGQEALEYARKENKLLIVSIGYSACHWCHVMEGESFNDPDVAAIMNQYFVSIKVDREERPDIDQIYMHAVQLLTGRGGWPLNAIALPDGRPVFGGTYFPTEPWKSLLLKISDLYRKNPDMLIKQADALTRGIRETSPIRVLENKQEHSVGDLRKIMVKTESQIDWQYGGLIGEPKFPLPVFFDFILKYQSRYPAEKILEALDKTLTGMARGGIYDQIGGGFARYSTDKYWKCPHFEKMLYDNAQLVSLYSRAFQLTRNPLYKTIVDETLEFIRREMTSPELPGGGIGFYSSLDADSEGEEGRFYTWKASEIDRILGRDAGLISDFYQVIPGGNWESGKNILYRNQSIDEFFKDKGLDKQKRRKILDRARSKLMEARSTRIRPPRDEKIITAWNALMMNGLVDAYRAFAEQAYLDTALKSALFISNTMSQSDGNLFRKHMDGSTSINGFLDDYAFSIQSFISLYQATFQDHWLHQAQSLLNHTFEYFFDPENHMFFYTSSLDPELIDRKHEIIDNVIPSSNSVMARNLLYLGIYFSNQKYIQKSKHMLEKIKPHLAAGPSSFANWGSLLMDFLAFPPQVTILGKNWLEKRTELDQHFLPQVLLAGGDTTGTIPVLQGKQVPDSTTIQVCIHETCLRATTDTDKALKQIRSFPEPKTDPVE
jgi:uncharacterized protein YyaL (SSP411 family)